MSKIGDISKKYKAEVEAVKKADYDARYGAHYNSVMLPHLRELDETFNKCVTEMKQKLDEEKNNYIAEQKTTINAQVESEYTSFFNAIDRFIEEG